ncbi:MAG: methyltransferase [Bacteroidetes bacterium]|nr:methyltransferase [Bacteroidota bacterium]
MPKTTFAFKEFVVRQDKCPMKISTDSVLIGAWVDSGKAKKILDIGTGTGVISLMLAQRSSAQIDAIDIDANSCKQAEINFSQSKWKERLQAHHSSLQEFFPKEKYDIIVSNPPYFPCPLSHEKKEGAQARFRHKLSFVELAENVLRLLASKGSFYVIFPVHEGAYFTNEAEKRNLFLTNYMWVKTTSRKKFPKRILMRFEFFKKEIQDDNLLVIQSENNFTSDYKQLTKEFYLHF